MFVLLMVGRNPGDVFGLKGKQCLTDNLTNRPLYGAINGGKKPTPVKKCAGSFPLFYRAHLHATQIQDQYYPSCPFTGRCRPESVRPSACVCVYKLLYIYILYIYIYIYI